MLRTGEISDDLWKLIEPFLAEGVRVRGGWGTATG
jgi:hypothetical protein